MSTTAAEAAACRRLWASVLLATFDDFNREHGQSNHPAYVLESARRYFVSRNGRLIASLAGADVDPDRILDVIALPRAAFRRRLRARVDPQDVEGEAA